MTPDKTSTCSVSIDELQSSRKRNGASLSFTSPPSDKSFCASPSPRQASLSFSSNNTCPLDYSTDIEADSLALLPISPVSLCDNDRNDNVSCPSEDPCKTDNSTVKDANVSTVAVLNGHINDTPNNNKIAPPAELALPHEEANTDVPSEVVTLNNSSNCNRRNSSGQSALSISSLNCFLEGIMLLIEKGADVNLADAFGRTPLHLACENTESIEHHKCIFYLLDHGAEVNSRGKSLPSAILVRASNSQ